MVRYGGYLEYAAANDIIMVFPQASWNPFGNEFACWNLNDYSND